MFISDSYAQRILLEERQKELKKDIRGLKKEMKDEWRRKQNNTAHYLEMAQTELKEVEQKLKNLGEI